MSEGKFAGLSAAIREAQENVDTVSRTETTETGKQRTGRAPGKRSNPNWKQHTVMLEKETHLLATDLLRRLDNGQDISDLLNSLLKDWVAQQKHKS